MARKARVLGGFDEQKNPLTNEQIAQREQAFRAANPVQRNITQQRAAEQGVPLDAFRKEGESRREFNVRLVAEPASITQEDINKKERALQELNVQQQSEAERNRKLASGEISQEVPQQFSQGLVDEQGNPMAGTPNVTPEIAQQNALAFGTKVAGTAVAGGVIGGTAAGLAGTGAVSAPVALSSKAASTSAIGKLAVLGASLGGSFFSVNKILGAFTTGKENRLKGDIDDITSQVKNIARDVSSTTNPADRDAALAEMERLESSAIELSGQLHVAMRNNQFNKITGEDPEEYLSKQLDLISRKKFAVKRLQATNDINAYNASLGADLPE